MKVLLITGGDVDFASAAGFLKEYQEPYVVAVDGGLDSVEKLSLVPDCIVGDFDTIAKERLAPYKERGVHFETHRPEKDNTDTELALLYALEQPGVTEVAVLGALGKRFDHALGNLHILLHGLKKGVFCYLADAYNRIYLLDGPRSFRKGETFGNYISFIPFTEQVTGVNLTGFKYPLHEATLVLGNSLGISNEIIGEEARMELSEGIVICVESRD